jgi:hypothetical protein
MCIGDLSKITDVKITPVSLVRCPHLCRREILQPLGRELK